MDLIANTWEYVEFFFKDSGTRMLDVLERSGSPVNYDGSDTWADIFQPTELASSELTIRLHSPPWDEPVSDVYKVAREKLGFSPSSRLFFTSEGEFSTQAQKTVCALVAHCLQEKASFFAVANDGLRTASVVGGYDADARRMYVGKGLNELLCEFAPANI